MRQGFWSTVPFDPFRQPRSGETQSDFSATLRQPCSFRGCLATQHPRSFPRKHQGPSISPVSHLSNWARHSDIRRQTRIWLKSKSQLYGVMVRECTAPYFLDATHRPPLPSQRHSAGRALSRRAQALEPTGLACFEPPPINPSCTSSCSANGYETGCTNPNDDQERPPKPLLSERTACGVTNVAFSWDRDFALWCILLSGRCTRHISLPGQ